MMRLRDYWRGHAEFNESDSAEHRESALRKALIDWRSRRAFMVVVGVFVAILSICFDAFPVRMVLFLIAVVLSFSGFMFTAPDIAHIHTQLTDIEYEWARRDGMREERARRIIVEQSPPVYQVPVPSEDGNDPEGQVRVQAAGRE